MKYIRRTAVFAALCLFAAFGQSATTNWQSAGPAITSARIGASPVLLAQAEIIPAPWLSDVLSVMQAGADRTYDSNVASFEQAKRDWIANNVRNRDLGLPISDFTKPTPERVVFYATSATTFDQRSVRDPNLTLPVLPPPVPTLPSGGLSTQAPAADALQQQMLSMILSKLMQLQAALDKLVAK